MQIISLEKIKRNSRIDGDEEDEFLATIGDVAEEMVSNMIHRTWYEVEADYGRTPAPLVHAVLMLVDHLYTNRSASGPVVLTTVPYGVSDLIRPYKRLV